MINITLTDTQKKNIDEMASNLGKYFYLKNVKPPLKVQAVDYFYKIKEEYRIRIKN